VFCIDALHWECGAKLNHVMTKGCVQITLGWDAASPSYWPRFSIGLTSSGGTGKEPLELAATIRRLNLGCLGSATFSVGDRFRKDTLVRHYASSPN